MEFKKIADKEFLSRLNSEFNKNLSKSLKHKEKVYTKFEI